MNELTSRYGDSLYLLALEANEVELWQNEVRELYDVIVNNKDILTVLSSEFLTIDERLEIVDKTFKDLRKEYVYLFYVVIKNHRVRFLPDILLAFISKANEYRGIKEGLVYSAYKLDKQTLTSIEDVIGKKEGMKIALVQKVDPTFIGGFKVVINDKVYDSTITSKIEKLKTKLMRNEG